MPKASAISDATTTIAATRRSPVRAFMVDKNARLGAPSGAAALVGDAGGGAGGRRASGVLTTAPGVDGSGFEPSVWSCSSFGARLLDGLPDPQRGRRHV